MSSTVSTRSAIGAIAVAALVALAACTRAPTVAAPPPSPPEQARSPAAELPGGPPAASLPGGQPMAAAPGSPSRPSWPGRAVTEWMETHHWTPASRDVLTTRRREDGVIVVSMQPIANPLWKARGHAAPKPPVLVKAPIKPVARVVLAPPPKPVAPPKPVVTATALPAPMPAPVVTAPAPEPSKFRFVWPHFGGFSIKALALPGQPMLAIPGVGKVHSEKVVLAGILIAIALLLIAIWRSAGSRQSQAERRRRFRTFESAKPATELEA